MIVVLDTTAITSDPYCSSTAWRVLAHASEQWDITLATTRVVVAEAVANYGRETAYSVEGLEKWTDKYGRLGLREVGASTVKSVQDMAARYADNLNEILRALDVEILEPDSISHMDLVNRAADRKKPCDSHGNGYRDSLNWLMLLSLAESRASEKLVWVTDNTNDFADDQGKAFHPDLLAELEERGLSNRVAWQPTLKALVLDIARQRSVVGDDNLRPFYEKLRRETLVDFITKEVLPAAEGSVVDPAKCGLYLATISAQVDALGEPQDLDVKLQSSISPGEAIAEFAFSADATLSLVLESVGEFEEGEISTVSGDGPPWVATVTKRLTFRGIMSLGPHEKPTGGEIVEIQAPEGDSGVAQWRRWQERARRINKQASGLSMSVTGMRQLQEAIRRSQAIITPEFVRKVQEAVEQQQRWRAVADKARQATLWEPGRINLHPRDIDDEPDLSNGESGREGGKSEESGKDSPDSE